VNLQLNADRQTIGEHPFGQRLRVQLSVHRGEVNGCGAPCECALCDNVARPLVVGAILHDELHLVMRTQALEVAPVIAMRFTAAGTLDVEDRDDLVGNARRCRGARRSRAARSCRDRAALHQRVDLFLEQRLTAGDLDERAAEGSTSPMTSSSARFLPS
jgi:hypothetical protein